MLRHKHRLKVEWEIGFLTGTRLYKFRCRKWYCREVFYKSKRIFWEC